MNNVESIDTSRGFSIGSRRGGVVALCLCLVVGLAACDSKNEQDGEGDKAEGGKQADEGKKSPDTVFTGDSPTFSKEVFAGLDFGADRETVKDKVSDDIGETVVDLPTSDDYEKVRFQASFGDDRERLVHFRILEGMGPDVDIDLLALAEEQWGEPDAVYEDPLGTHTYWFNPEAGIRANGKDTNLRLSRYVPVSEFIGEEGGELKFIDEPILGKNLDEIYESYGDRLGTLVGDTDLDQAAEEGNWDEVIDDTTKVGLRFLPTEFGASDTFVELHLDDDGKVEQLTFTLSYHEDLADRRSKALEAFESNFGEPEPFDKLGGEAYRYSDDPEVVAGQWPKGSEDLRVEVDRAD